jgi:carbon monoxide dehydrogenase subunit G
MAVEVEIVVNHVFNVKSQRAEVYTLLSDVPRSVSHFPDVVELLDRGDNVYEWVMKSKGPPGFEHAVRYACRYICNEEDDTVSWSPVDGVGNAVFSGTWRIESTGSGTRIQFGTQATLSIPAPRLLRSAVAPYADKALRGEIDQYLENLQKTLNG